MICFQFWVSLTSLSLWWPHSCYHWPVVICFQFWVSLTSLSLLTRDRATGLMLWFAFNFGYLWHRYHYGKRFSEHKEVVICFQFWVSLTSLSLGKAPHTSTMALWFAFNFGYLWHRYHSHYIFDYLSLGCDLLSILGIFDIAITRDY